MSPSPQEENRYLPSPFARSSSYALPTPPDGDRINPKQILVNYLPGPGGNLELPRVDDQAACGNTKSFYYDDNERPKHVIFCPDACSSMSGGRVEVVFGCIPDVK